MNFVIVDNNKNDLGLLAQAGICRPVKRRGEETCSLTRQSYFYKKHKMIIYNSERKFQHSRNLM